MQELLTIPLGVRAEIEGRLARVAREEGVRLLMAIESGSRAWGFPSPDSDYDVRFLYIRPRRDYLALRAVRDVIERPIVDEIDLNGWDLRKALTLLLKHNAVLSEWIESPIVTSPMIRWWRGWLIWRAGTSTRADMPVIMPAWAEELSNAGSGRKARSR